MEKQKITRAKKAVPWFEHEGAEWQTVGSTDNTAAIYNALDDPARSTIFELLDAEPIRQVDLARLVSEALGRPYDVAAIRHHLEILKQAGLIAYEEYQGGQTKVKMVYRTADVELRVRKRAKPEVFPTPIESAEDWLHEFRRKRSAP